jgi:hypothetical protein
MVQQLQGVLLGHGGHRVVVIPTHPDPHMKEILEFGKVFRPERIRKHRGKRNRCHQNVVKLYLAGKKYRGAQIATGYGLSEDGIWGSHSWLVRDDEIIETTEPRTLYFGRVFPEEAALAFCISEG